MGEFQIDRDEIREKSPFRLRNFGRVIPQAVVYDPDFDSEGLPDYVEEQDWLTYFPDPEGGLTVLRGGEMYQGVYFGVESAEDDDIQIPFFTNYYQHASFPNIIDYFPSIAEDVRNLSSSMSKLALYQYHTLNSDIDARAFVRTELEQIFSTSRSIFDTLYLIAKESWETIHLYDGGQQDLPNNLTDMVLVNYDPVSRDTLVEDYSIPDNFAEYLEELATVLSDIKYYRDSIHHYGRSLRTVFELEEGLAVDTSEQPYSDFDAWSDVETDENDLGPIWPFVAEIIGSTIEMMNGLFGAVFANMKVPPELAPDYGVYLRGPYISNLLDVNDLTDEDPWGSSLVEDIEARLDQ